MLGGIVDMGILDKSLVTLVGLRVHLINVLIFTIHVYIQIIVTLSYFKYLRLNVFTDVTVSSTVHVMDA